MVPRVVPTAVAALGLPLALVGLLMLTLAAPPQQVGGDTRAAPLLLTGPGVLALTGAPVDVSLDGEGFVGLGRADEVTAWVDGVAHTRLDGVAADLTPAGTDVDGAAPDAVDPVADVRAADIWQQESAGDSPSLRVEAPTPDEVLVVSAAGGATVSVVWQRPATHPGAWPLLLGGVLLLWLGLAWLVQLNRRRLRRRAAGPRPKRAAEVRA